MAHPSEAPLPKWLIYGALIPLAPFLLTALMRYMNYDDVTWQHYWCDELPCFAFEMALLLTLRCFTELKTRSIYASKVWWVRLGGIVLLIPCTVFFVSFCLSQTSIIVPLHLRWNLCKLLFVDIGLLIFFWFTFPRLRAKISSGVRP